MSGELGFVMVRCAGCGEIASIQTAHWKHGSVCELTNRCKGEMKRQHRLEQQIIVNLGEAVHAASKQPAAPKTVSKVYVVGIGGQLSVYESKADALVSLRAPIAYVQDSDIRWAIQTALTQGEIARAFGLWKKADKKEPHHDTVLRFEEHEVRPDSQRKETK